MNITVAGLIFVASVLLIAYVYAGYPLLMWVLARWAGDDVARGPGPRAVSIIIAAYNERANVQRRLHELLHALDRLEPSSEIILVSDGSTDGTDQAAREIDDPRVRVIQQPSNMGKAVALNTGVDAASNSIIIFGDTRQQWDENAVDCMLENFADQDVGAVSGDLVFRAQDGSLAGVGMYWKLEKWIRKSESRVHSSVQVAGAICAVRRELFTPIPAGTILDDVYWPQHVAMKGWRVIHEPRAIAYDRLPDRPRDEIRRKVRTLSGNFQLVRLAPSIIMPWRNPTWFSVISHKLLRLVVPFAMIAALIAAAVGEVPWLRWMLVIQLAGYAVGIGGIMVPALSRNRIVNAVSALLVLNAAALMSWYVFFAGRTNRSWKKVTYTPAPAHAAGSVPAGS